jgi:hypothetical protein
MADDSPWQLTCLHWQAGADELPSNLLERAPLRTHGLIFADIVVIGDKDGRFRAILPRRSGSFVPSVSYWYWSIAVIAAICQTHSGKICPISASRIFGALPDHRSLWSLASLSLYPFLRCNVNQDRLRYTEPWTGQARPYIEYKHTGSPSPSASPAIWPPLRSCRSVYWRNAGRGVRPASTLR